MAFAIEAGMVVASNLQYQVSVSGEFELNDLVLCRRVVDTNGPNCAFLAASVLGIEEEAAS
jgi:hypothetical protein